jgi:glycosyltransferase involved in cell wall biosynthesis
MRLAILTAQISPYHNARYNSVARQFSDVHVISSVNQGDFEEFLANSFGGYSVHKLFHSRREYEAASQDMVVSKRTGDALADWFPDAVAVAGWSAPESLAALEYGRENDIPVIVMSESQKDDAPRSILREAVKRRVVSQFDGALVGGPPHADYVVQLGIPRRKVHLGYNSVDNDHFQRGAEMARVSRSQVKAKYGLPQRYFLASARFITKKNLPILINAYALARRQHGALPDLVILGDGPERPALEKAIATNHLEGFVHLPGFRGYDLLPAFYALSEGFLHVSSTEQWGLVINEAMACGVPVIATHTCGAARTVIRDGVSGILTGADVASIAAALLRLIGMPEGLRAEMGSAAADAIRDWGPQKFGLGLRAAIDAAQEAPSRGPLAPLDKFIVRFLQRSTIEKVQ